MAIYQYQYRIQAQYRYNPAMVYNRPTDINLNRFSELLWHGNDAGYCVYRKDPFRGDIVRIDFYPPY